MYDIKPVTGIALEVREALLAVQDDNYRIFMLKLMPGVDSKHVLGVRSPATKKVAKDFAGREDIDIFLEQLPHGYYEENNVHSLIISGYKDYDDTLAAVERLLPYIDNWATCDSMNPKTFRKHRDKLAVDIERWLQSDHTYTVRFGIGMIMGHFLDEDFDEKWLERVSRIRSDEYYINMMTAWYFATALAKQWEATLPYIENGKLDKWTHNKAIQKAIESYRVTDEQKAYLRTLKVK